MREKDALKQRILSCVQQAFDPDDAQEWLQEYLDNVVHNYAAQEASSVNNQGPEAQLDYIAGQDEAQGLVQILMDLEAELAANPAQRPDRTAKGPAQRR
jgi:hypothetical protein